MTPQENDRNSIKEQTEDLHRYFTKEKQLINIWKRNSISLVTWEMQIKNHSKIPLCTHQNDWHQRLTLLKTDHEDMEKLELRQNGDTTLAKVNRCLYPAPPLLGVTQQKWLVQETCMRILSNSISRSGVSELPPTATIYVAKS